MNALVLENGHHKISVMWPIRVFDIEIFINQWLSLSHDNRIECFLLKIIDFQNGLKNFREALTHRVCYVVFVSFQFYCWGTHFLLACTEMVEGHLLRFTYGFEGPWRQLRWYTRPGFSPARIAMSTAQRSVFQLQSVFFLLQRSSLENLQFMLHPEVCYFDLSR